MNISGGSGQPTSKRFSVYLHLAKSSVLECIACIKIAVQEKFIFEKDVDNINNLLRDRVF